MLRLSLWGLIGVFFAHFSQPHIYPHTFKLGTSTSEFFTLSGMEIAYNWGEMEVVLWAVNVGEGVVVNLQKWEQTPRSYWRCSDSEDLK